MRIRTWGSDRRSPYQASGPREAPQSSQRKAQGPAQDPESCCQMLVDKYVQANLLKVFIAAVELWGTKKFSAVVAPEEDEP